jgi:hypothetical protein
VTLLRKDHDVCKNEVSILSNNISPSTIPPRCHRITPLAAWRLREYCCYKSLNDACMWLAMLV